MAFTQQTFLGSSICKFSASIGWSREPSNLTITLVDDPLNGDSFSPPLAGRPVIFEYDTWWFGGILQSWVSRKDQSGNPIYVVTVTDPREILNGVQLIIDGYTGFTYDVPNLYNIYGYVESTYGYGSAFVNEGGMPWTIVRNGFLELQATTPIQFRGYRYYVDFTNLPTLPNFFRIPGKYLTLMEFVEQVCEATSHDFFFTMFLSNGKYYIKINTISRQTEPNLGTINNFVNSVNANSSEAGVELRNEITSKFLVGGFQENMEYVGATPIGSVDASIGGNIWPFWGYNVTTGKLIIGKGDPEGYYTYTGIVGTYTSNKFTIDIAPVRLDDNNIDSKYKDVDPVNGIPYYTDSMEIRAVLSGQDAWESFLIAYNDQINTPHYQKARKLNIIDATNVTNIKAVVADGTRSKKIRIEEIIAFGSKCFNIADMGDDASNHSIEIKRLYSYLYTFAKEYYGRKFMVNLSTNLMAKYDTITGKVVTSVSPISSAYLDESLWPAAYQEGYLPEDTVKFTDDENRYYGYAIFTNYLNTNGSKNYDLSELGEDEFTISIVHNSVFVKCTIDSNIRFSDRFITNDVNNGRVIVTLNSPVHKNTTKSVHTGFIKAVCQEHLKLTHDEVLSLYAKVAAAVGIGYRHPNPAMPDMIAVPLRSNINMYGPWYVIGSAGKTEFEQDLELVPWNYGGYTQMNIEANMRLQNIASTYQASEMGSVTFPGTPVINIGGLLVAGGPYVTDVSVDVGEAGVTTTYRMKTWTWEYGKVGKVYHDRMKKLYDENRRRRRELAEFRKMVTGITAGYLSSKHYEPIGKGAKRENPHTPHVLIAGEISDADNSGVRQQSTTMMSSMDDIALTMNTNFNQKVVASLDTLFRPFSVDPSGIDGFSGPKFVVPSGSTPTVNNLNPFIAPHDFAIISHGSGIPNDAMVHYDYGSVGDKYRVMGLRAPTILVGWGYDINGKPVPNATPGSPGDSFIANYRQRMDLWKVGPLDSRWDESRGVWVTGVSSSGCKIGYIDYGVVVANNSTVSVDIWSAIGDTGNNETCLNITGVSLSGALQLMIDYPPGYSYGVISPYEWTRCA